MPTDLPVLALIGIVAAAVALAVFDRTGAGSRTAQAHRRGPVGRFVDVLDASIAMYLVRQMLGQGTATRAEGRAERARQALAAAEEDARDASARRSAAIAPTRLVVAGTAASHTVRDLRDRQAHRLAAAAPEPVSRPSVAVSRGGAIAAAGLAAVLIGGFIGGFLLWPRSEGAVLSATGTPGPSPSAELPSGTPVVAGTPSPGVAATASASPTSVATPSLTAAPTPTPTPTRTLRPTARPTNTPRPTARPTARPTPTASSNPTPTAEPTPAPTPYPTPEPTPEPTPAPTPEPTPDPTP